MEILGFGLEKAFSELGVVAQKKYQGGRFEVWELSNADYQRICSVPDEDWKEDWGWWRSGRCILEGNPLHEYCVHGEKMLGWLDEEREKEEDSDYIGCPYSTFTDWLIFCWGLGTEKNIACFATSLAKHNGLTLAEFMQKYQGVE